MARRKLHYQEISRLAPLLRAGKLSPVELTEALLERVEA
jgi:Asp-tRNA(Asn)/Glu-tRNA(Gln) amidotransferase A subunit family amidase